VRWFLPQPVDRAIIDQAIEIGALAPSACNRQPFQFRILDDPELVRQIIKIPFGLAGYGHNVPVVVAVIGQQRHYFDERDRHLIYIDASLAVMGFLFALEAQGIGTCCVNCPDIAKKEAQMAELMNLSLDERPVMLIALGHPDPEGLVARSTKKSISQLRRYNLE
jgi:nitroreductase